MRESLGVSVVSTPQSEIKTRNVMFRDVIHMWYNINLEEHSPYSEL